MAHQDTLISRKIILEMSRWIRRAIFSLNREELDVVIQSWENSKGERIIRMPSMDQQTRENSYRICNVTEKTKGF